MPGIIVPQRWRQQPRGPVQIDWSNPITRGLVDALIPADLVTVRGARTSTASLVQAHGLAGRARVSTDGASAGVNDLYPTFGLIAPPITHFGVYRLTGTPGGARRFLGTEQAVSSGYSFAPNGTNFRALVSGGSPTVLTGSAVSTALKCDVHVINGSTQALYENGVLTAGPSAYASYAVASVGYYVGASANTASAGAEVYLSAVWSRELSAAEIRSLADNPWQIFQPIPARTWAMMTGAAANFPLSVSPVSYAISGQSVATLAGRRLSASPASYSIAGQSVSLVPSRRLAVSPASYAVTGQNVTLTYTPASPVLAVSPAAYAVTGKAVTLTYTPASGPCPTVDQIATAVYAKLLSEDFAGLVADAVIARFNAAAVPVNVQYVNGLTVDGTGTEADPWGPA